MGRPLFVVHVKKDLLSFLDDILSLGEFLMISTN